MGLLGDIFDVFFGWLAPEPQKQGNQGTELTKVGTEEFIPKVYGQVKNIGCIVVFKKTNDFDNDDIKNDLYHSIVVWADNVVSIDTVYLDNFDINSRNDLFIYENARYAYAINFINGMTGYNDPRLRAAGWDATDQWQGKACSYIRLERGNGENLLNSEVQITADITGTSSSNPADHLLDYLTAPIYGKNLSTDLIDLNAIASARATCNTQVETYTDSNVYRPLFTSNTVIDTSETVLTNVNKILKSMRALMPVLDGKLTPIIEKDDPPVSLEIFEDDILQLGRITNSNKSNRYNRVVVKYYDNDANGTAQEAIYPAKDSATETLWLSQDQGIVLEKSLTLDTCRDYYEALAFAKTFALVSREQLRTKVTLGIWATLFEVGDIVKVSHAYPGWEGKLFRIENTVESDIEVSLTLREHQPYVYDFANTGLKPNIPDSVRNVAGPTKPSNISQTAVYLGQSQVELTWTGTTNEYQYQIIKTNDTWINGRVNERKLVINNLKPATYKVLIRALSKVGRFSPWVEVTVTITKYAKQYIWRVYASDDEGADISLTDTNLPFVGILYDAPNDTPDISDPSVYAYFPNNASRWIYASGPPSAAIGSFGDNYLNTTNNDVYTKSATGWVGPVANFGNADGDTFSSGSANPASSFGSDGDTYLNLTTYQLFKKVSGNWVSQGIIKGEKGVKGDTGQSTWEVFNSATNKPGIPTGAGTSDGWSYTQTSSSKWASRQQNPNQPTNGGWGPVYRILGEDGAKGPKGDGGDDGASAYDIWLSQGNSGSIQAFLNDLNGSDGIDGNEWFFVSSGAPANSLGKINDFALSNGRLVYQKTGSSTWTYRRDLLGPVGPAGPQGPKGDDGDPGAPAPGSNVVRDDGSKSVFNFNLNTIYSIVLGSGTWNITGVVSGSVDAIKNQGSPPFPADSPTRVKAYLYKNGSLISGTQQDDPDDLSYEFNQNFYLNWSLVNQSAGTYQIRLQIQNNQNADSVAGSFDGFLQGSDA